MLSPDHISRGGKVRHLALARKVTAQAPLTKTGPQEKSKTSSLHPNSWGGMGGFRNKNSKVSGKPLLSSGWTKCPVL